MPKDIYFDAKKDLYALCNKCKIPTHVSVGDLFLCPDCKPVSRITSSPVMMRIMTKPVNLMAGEG